MLQKEDFANALKRIRPVQRPNAWINNLDAQMAEVLSSAYIPSFTPGAVGDRKLSVPPVHDRIIQGAIQLHLYPVLENQKPQGLKEIKGTQKSLEAVNTYLTSNTSGVFFKSDIKGFFSSLNQTKTLETLERIFNYSGWTKNAVESVVKSNSQGIPQGSPLSPLLADATLLHLDKQMYTNTSVFYLRYVDDILLLATNVNELNKAKEVLINYLKDYDLTLSPQKTISGNYPEKGFSLLGMKFFNSINTDMLLQVVGGSPALEFPLYPGEEHVLKGITNSGVSRSDQANEVTYSLDHFLKTILDKPHIDCLEMLVSKNITVQTVWGEKAQASKDKFLHKGMGKPLHDYAFKTYVGQIKPLKEANKPIPLKEASSILRCLIIGNSILEEGKFPTDFIKYKDDYTNSLTDLNKGEFSTFHSFVSKLFKANYKLRQANNLPDVMPYYHEVSEGEDFLDIN